MQTKWKLPIIGVLCSLFILLVAQSSIFAAPSAADDPATAVGQKVLAPAGVLNADQPGVTLWHDYGAFALYKLTDDALSTLSSADRQRITAGVQMDRVLLDAYPFDTQRDTLSIPAAQQYDSQMAGPALQLIQFVGPIKDGWLEDVKSVGAEPVHYIANNAYLVWTDQNGRDQLAKMAADKEFLQFSTLYQPYFKFGPTLRDRAGLQADDLLTVTVQMYRHNGRTATEQLVSELAVESAADWEPILAYQNAIVTVPASALDTLAQQPDIYWIGERLERERMDEVQGQILAGNLNGDQSGPSDTGYLDWLDSYGFSQDPADYPVVDVTDDGIGNGDANNSGDYSLHELGLVANPSRLAYVANCTANATGEGTDGHGHINVSIVGGYDPNEGAGFPFEDPNGYLRGMGINPYGRLAGTRIFGGSYDVSACGGTDVGVIKSSQDNGAHISTNSWGCSGCAGSYDESSQAYDVGTRDADLDEAGNQEMMFVFSAGNSGTSGAGTIGSPGNGKNMLTVGASENQRPTDEDGNWTDGCAVGPSGADDAMDIIDFSSRGPAPGGRAKPEIIAPGTHIQGTASTNSNFNGSGVCDQYRPGGQTTFAASSGTSHSAPAVAGVSSLVYYWLQNNQPVDGTGSGYAPSPAAVKAYVMNHPTYLTGVDAGDTLPSNNQGYGMPNMGAMFDSTPKYVLDQTRLFDNTGETWVWNGGVADPSKPVRIMLAYTDKAGAIGTSPQVNDLNLTATINGTPYLGNQFDGQWSTTGGVADALNNYEAVFLPAGTSGALEITITAANIADDGVPDTGDGTDQDFALVCYNCSQEPGFGLATTPGSQDVCAPDDALYNVDIASILGYSATVDLTAVGNPSGTTASFGTSSDTVPYSTTLTIGDTGAASFGSYEIGVVGTGPTATYTSTVGLDLYTAVPDTPSLMTPADGAVDQLLRPAFSWDDINQAQTYLLEVAEDSGFTNVVYTATVNATSHTMEGLNLDADTTYYWRVRAANICGDGTYSSTYSFTTVLLFCSAPDLAISDNTTVSDSLSSSRMESLSDLNVTLDVNHTFIGDLDITLTHEDSDSSVVLLPESFSCSGGDIDVNFDDEASDPISCSTDLIPALGGDVQPDGSLSTFDFLQLAGTWRLDVSDNAGGDQGTVNEWCLQPAFTAAVGSVAGTVTDDNTGQPIENVHITLDDGNNAYTTMTDNAGQYARPVGSGSYTVTAVMGNYDTGSTAGVIVSDGMTTTVDFTLTAGQLASSRSGIATSLSLGDSVNTSWSLTNTGSADVSLDILSSQTGYNPTANRLAAGEDLLIVNDGGFNTTAVNAFAAAAANLGYTSAITTSSSFVNMAVADLLNYEAVIYAGTATFSTGSQEALQTMSYLDMGGNLIVADNDLGYWANSNGGDDAILYEQYLQATYGSDGGSGGVLTGVDIMTGIDPDISSDPFPDDFTLGAEATGIFEAPSGNWAGSTVDRNGYKAVYFAWDFHHAGGDSTGDAIETDILGAALDWILGGDDLWLSTDVVTATLDSGVHTDVLVTTDAGLVPVGGVYYGALTVRNDTPYGDLVVPVTMTVECPTCGTLAGELTDDFTGDNITGTLQITNSAGLDYDISDVSSYTVELLPDTYYLTASATDYLPQTAVVTITGGMTTTADIALTPAFAELVYAPGSIEEAMQVGDTVTNTVTVTNTGTIDMEFGIGIVGFTGPETTGLQKKALLDCTADKVDSQTAVERYKACAAGETTVDRSAALGPDNWATTPFLNDTVAPGESTSFDVTFSTEDLYQLGTYRADLSFFFGNFSNVVPVMPLTMDLSCPDCGMLTGTIYDADTDELLPAEIAIAGPNAFDAVFNNTAYTVTVPAGTYTLTVTADGYISQTETVMVSAGMTNTNDVRLRLNAPLVEVTPSSFEATLQLGDTSTQTLDIGNRGAVSTPFNIAENLARGLVPDGSFEADPSSGPWAETDSTDCTPWIGDWSDIVGVNAHDGSQYFWAGGGCNFQANSNSAYQQVTIPAGTAQLSFWYWANRSSPDDPTDNGEAYVQLNGEDVWTLETSQGNNTNDWTQVSVDVSAYAGQTAELRLGLEQGASGFANVFFDTVDIATGQDVAWLSTMPVSGTVAADSGEMVDVMFDTSVLTATGTYTATLSVLTEDPMSPAVIPVTLTVTAPSADMTLDVTVSTSNECGTVDTVSVTMGDTVYYCYTVHNTGDALLPHHVITDSVYGHIDTFLFDLHPDATESVVYSQTVTGTTMSMAMWEASNANLDVAVTAMDMVTVTVQAPYGLDLVAMNAMSTTAGSTVTYTVMVTNTGTMTDTFDITTSGNTWTTTAPADITLTGGESGSFMVTVDVPDTAAADDSDMATVMLTSQGDSAISADVMLTTTSLGSDSYNLYLPLVIR